MALWQCSPPEYGRIFQQTNEPTKRKLIEIDLIRNIYAIQRTMCVNIYIYMG